MSKRIDSLPPAWLLGFGNAVFGLVGGFLVLPLPQMLAHQGVDPLRIAAVSAACFSPGFWTFALGPLLDVRFSRRAWAAFFAVVAGITMACAVMLREHLVWLEAMLIVSYTAATLSSNALGGWLASLLPSDNEALESQVSAWTQVALFLGNGLMAALAGELLRKASLSVAAVVLGLLVVLPVAVFPFIPLPRDERRLQVRDLAGTFAEFWQQLRTLLVRREVVLTLALFILPTGSFALTNQLGGVAAKFGATDQFVSRMGGVVLSIAGAAACLLVPVLARRLKLLRLYLGIGVAGCLFTVALLTLPRNPEVFAVGFLGENVFQAMSFTAAVAICLEVIGRENPLAGTLFGLLTSATVLPILAMGVVDGRAFAWHGVPGMVGVDGLVGLIACLVMMTLVIRKRTPKCRKR